MATAARPVNVLIAPQAFKGSFGPREVARLLARGVLDADPTLNVECLPIADGGDGLLEAVLAPSATCESVPVRDPLGRVIDAELGWLDAHTAVFESAAACGIALLTPAERDPLFTSTEGVADMLIAARKRGAETVVVGLGGSATVDGGTGLARGLGWRFVGIDGTPLHPGGGDLSLLDAAYPGPPFEARVIGLRDVVTPLVGPDGAARVFGPQKGAGADEVERLEAGLESLAGWAESAGHRDAGRIEGSGAAGGLGAGIDWFAGGSVVSGIDWVLERVGFDRRLGEADLLITAEGAFDRSSLMGKGTGEVLARAEVAGVTTAVVAGRTEPDLGLRSFVGPGGWLDAEGLVRLGRTCACEMLGLSGP